MVARTAESSELPKIAVWGIGAAVAAALAGAVAWVLRPRAPRGKGAFVRSLIADTPTPESMVRAAEALDLDWLALIGESDSGQVSTHYPDRLPAYAEALKRAGIDVWIWGWPEPGSVERFAEQVGGTAKQVGASGVIVNAEKPFYHSRHADAARRVMQATKAASGGKPIGFTSYGGGPPWHPRFPWSAFAETSDFGMPQIYDSQHKLPRDYPTDSVAAWKRAGFGPVVPIWGASNRHTAAQMLDIAARTPITDRGASWWTLDHALKSPSRSEVLAGYVLPRGREEVAVA